MRWTLRFIDGPLEGQTRSRDIPYGFYDFIPAVGSEKHHGPYRRVSDWLNREADYSCQAPWEWLRDYSRKVGDIWTR